MITSTPGADLSAQVQTQIQPKSRTRIARSRSQWKALLAEFNNSGLTRTAFCKKHRIATSSLYRWRQIFADHARGADFIDVTQPLSSTPTPPPAHARDNNWQVELELGAGIVLRLRTT